MFQREARERGGYRNSRQEAGRALWTRVPRIRLAPGKANVTRHNEFSVIERRHFARTIGQISSSNRVMEPFVFKTGRLRSTYRAKYCASFIGNGN